MTLFKTDLKTIPEKAPNKPDVVFGLFKDLNKPFRSLYSQFAPIRGINKETLKNLRLHGHYGPAEKIIPIRHINQEILENRCIRLYCGPERKGFPRPKWDGIDPYNFPQDWTASLLEFFAPSYIGFLFDSIPSTPFHSWFKPANIALIFNTISEESFYNNARDGVLKLARCLQPNADFIQLEKQEQKRLAFRHEGPLYGEFAQLQCLSWPTKERPFAEILFEALNETKGDEAAKLGYPNHIVELILLTYMWDRKQSKLDLKPFYEHLSDRIIDKPEVEKITWENEGSFYTEKEYFEVVAQYNKKQPMSLEGQTLLQLGYPYFEDPFPPIQSYGVSVFKKGKKSESFSDCGEISLLNYLMIALYDFDTKRFHWERLESLKEQGFKVNETLIHFFRYIYKSPISDFTSEIRNAWANVLSALNADSTGDLIQYLKDECCIAPGLDNMINVMKKLLQPPIDYYSDILFALLNLEKDSRYWFRENHKGDDKNVTLTFCQRSDKDTTYDKIFKWHFQTLHFDFNRLQHAKYQPASQLLEGLKAAINENSYRYPSSKTFTMPKPFETNNEAAFAAELFQGNLESIEGKCYALYNIFWFKNKCNSSCFDYLIQRWLEPQGKYFAGWEDFYTNKTLLKILMQDCKLSIATIDDMNIPALSAHIRTKIVYGDVKRLDTIASEDEDIIIFGGVYGKVTSTNGRIKIIGDIGSNGCVINVKGAIEIQGHVCGHIKNESGNNTITGTIFKLGHVKNAIGNNEINGDVCGHVENESGNNQITATVYKNGHVTNSTGSNEIGGDIYGSVENSLLTSASPKAL